MFEIMFRGRRIDRKGWVFGDLLTSYPHHNGATIVEYGCVYTEVSSVTVGQYIGRKDSIGNKIYRGDIVSFAGAVGEIVFEAPSFYWALPDEEDLLDIPLDGEVVGNIHDNPELLTL